MSHPVFIESLKEVLELFDIAVLDQWGVLHDGSTSYLSACEAMRMLRAHGKEICILSNSGKRADLNWARIGRMGLPVNTISRVVTSGEALWQDLKESRIQVAGRIPKRFFPICGHPDDARIWADDSEVEIADKLTPSCDAILLMGLPDGTKETEYDEILRQALKLTVPFICSNPDKTSPRGDRFVISPGALADRFEGLGGQVVWYGKPHAPIFDAVRRFRPDLAPDRFLMIGDSLEHDIAGGQGAGFKTALVRRGIHTGDFPISADHVQLKDKVQSLAERYAVQAPDFCLNLLA